MSAVSFHLLFTSCLLLLLVTTPTNLANDCSSPSTSFLEIRLSNLLAAKGGEGDSPTVAAQDTPHYTCQVQGTTMGTYQELSVVLRYTTDTNSNPRIRQFELDCVAGGGSNDWQERAGSLSSVLTGSFMDIVSDLGTFTNCSDCNENAGNDNHCIACDPACLDIDGLMRCTGMSSSDCCAAFESDGTCKANTDCTTSNFIANEQNSYTCSCGLDSSSCDPGYTFNGTACSCVFTNICLRDTPCQNGGTCVLNKAPSDYTCTCTGTGYTGDNCTEVVVHSTTISTSSSAVTVSTTLSTQVLLLTTTNDNIMQSTSIKQLDPTKTLEIQGNDSNGIIYAVIGSIIGFMLIVIIVIVTASLIYYFAGRKNTNLNKINPEAAFANSQVTQNNPLYVGVSEAEKFHN